MKRLLQTTRRSFLQLAAALFLFKSPQVLGYYSAQKKSKNKFTSDISCGSVYPTLDNLTFQNTFRRYIRPEQFYQGSDGDDYTHCISKALRVAAQNNGVVFLSRRYRISNSLRLLDDITIIGCSGSELFCDENNPINLIEAYERKNIRISGVNFNGNVTNFTEKKYTRVIRFINCKNVVLDNISAGNSADWCISFEGCTGVSVADVNIYGGGRYSPGGRDGIHFLDCNYFTVNRAIIDSGDDCIGITTKNTGSCNGVISDVIGGSEIGSIVIYNEEMLADGKYTHNNLENLTIKNISVSDGSIPKNIVRVIGYNPSSNIRNVIIDKVTGISYNHSVFIGRVHKLTISNINVSSLRQHGVYIANSSNIVGKSIVGHSRAKNFHGVNIFKCQDVIGGFTSKNDNELIDIYTQYGN